MPLAALVFIDTCTREGVPLDIAVQLFMSNNHLHIDCDAHDYCVHWIRYSDKCSCVEIIHDNGKYQNQFFLPDGSRGLL